MDKDCTNCDKTFAEHAEDECNPFAGMTMEEIDTLEDAYWYQVAKDSERQYLDSLRYAGNLDPTDERLWI